MNIHKCKVCMKIFGNGRALGGHMRSHLLPLTPSKRARHHQLTESASSSSNSQLIQLEVVKGEVDNGLDKKWVGLRDNLKKKKNVKVSDPGFLDAGSSVVEGEDGESETTEIIQNPSQKRTQTQGIGKEVQVTSTASMTEMSCVSDGSTDEEVALCLMMLSKDKWVIPKQDKSPDNNRSKLLKPDNNFNSKPSWAKYKCSLCSKNFRSQKALSGHKTTSNKMCQEKNTEVEDSGKTKKIVEDQKIYECPFCYKVFGSGQALGGHKRSHLLGTPSPTTTTTTSTPAVGVVDKVGTCFIDLNFPAPIED